MSKLYKRGQVFYIRYRPSPGAPFKWESLFTRNKREAQARRVRMDRALTAQILMERPDRPAALSFDRLKTIYEEWASIQRESDTIYQTKLAVDKFTDTTGVTHIAQVTPQHIEHYKRTQLKRRLGKDGAKSITGRTVNKDLRTLRAAVNVAKDLKVYDRENPFSKFRELPEPKRLPRWLNDDQIRALMTAAAKAGRNEVLIFALGIYAGLRKEEIVECRWEWIDFDNSILSVQATEFWRPKDKDERAIDLGDALAQILRRNRDRITGYVIEPQNPAVMDGYRYHINFPYRKVVTAAKLTWCSCKRLRYTFASQLAIKGAELFYIQKQMGHADPMTTQVYAHLASRKDLVNRIPVPTEHQSNSD